MVRFEALHYPASAERISEKVYISSCGTGILEFFLFLPAVQLGSTCSTFRMGVHPVHERLQPSVSHLDVGVDQKEIFRSYGSVVKKPEGLVVSSGESEIPFETKGLYVREHASHDLDASVGGCVVSNYHFCPAYL